MKKITQCLFMAFIVSLSLAATAQEKLLTSKFTVENMTCRMCHITVKKAIESVDGVVKATVDYDSKVALVSHHENTKIDAIEEATKNAGYPAKIAEDK